LHEEHNTGSVFCPREQEQMVGAEVEHGSRRTRPESGSDELPPPPAAPLRGYPADSSARDIITERAKGFGIPGQSGRLETRKHVQIVSSKISSKLPPSASKIGAKWGPGPHPKLLILNEAGSDFSFTNRLLYH
jgi:hypothetical protein